MRRAEGSETGTRRAPTIETSPTARSPNHATPNARSSSAPLPPPRHTAHAQLARSPCTAPPGFSLHSRSIHPRDLRVPADSLSASSSLTLTYRTFPFHTFAPSPPSTETPRDTNTMDGAARPALGAHSASSVFSGQSIYSAWSEGKMPPRWRHTVGIILLLVTVVLWTASNFLASVSTPSPLPPLLLPACTMRASCSPRVSAKLCTCSSTDRGPSPSRPSSPTTRTRSRTS